MPRAKFQPLPEQMFYILLCLYQECCGMDIMEKVTRMTDGPVSVGPGTLYNLLENFLEAGMIRETKAEGRKRSYVITEAGKKARWDEQQRLLTLISDYEHFAGQGGDSL